MHIYTAYSYIYTCKNCLISCSYEIINRTRYIYIYDDKLIMKLCSHLALSFYITKKYLTFLI